jgi:hypothetical protein
MLPAAGVPRKLVSEILGHTSAVFAWSLRGTNADIFSAASSRDLR